MDWIGRLREHRLELDLDLLQHLLQHHDAGAKVRADLIGDFLRRLHPHVGLHERMEQFVDELVIDQLPFLLEEVADVGIEELRGLLKTLLEFFE